MHPAHETRMRVAGDVGFDGGGEILVQRRRVHPRAGQRGVESGADIRRHFLPHRLFGDAGQMVDHVIHHPVPQGAEMGEIFWVQRAHAAL